MPNKKSQVKPKRAPVSKKVPARRPAGHPDEDTTPAQEWGERLATGKAIARGGKETGYVPGATEQH